MRTSPFLRLSWLIAPAFAVAADQPDSAAGTDSVQELRAELRREQEHIRQLEERLAIDAGASFASLLSSPRTARAVGGGVNWYLNSNFKTQLDYEVTRYIGGATLGNLPAERVLISQFALIF